MILRSAPRFAFQSALILAMALSVRANVALTSPFTDHMVLQRRTSVPVWGTAAAGEAVTVAFRGQSKAATAASDGKWKVALDASEAGGPFTLTAAVAGKNTVTLQDVMVGEVWLAGGQSNMAFSMKTIAGPNLDTAKTADHPDLRLMNFQNGGKWNVCTPAVALDFAATAFYYGRELQKSLQVPVGIVLSAIGGTEIERWMDPVAIKADPLIANDTAVGHLYDKWIAPLAGFGIKGVIWYQGEYNASTNIPAHPAWVVSNYRGRFQALIAGWRQVWGQGDFPFHYVQLPNINGAQGSPAENSPWAEMREAQRLSLTNPNTAMIVTIDIGEANNLHPYDKWDVGRRLNLAAQARVYGDAKVIYSGPMYQSMQIKGNTIRLFFRDADGLKIKGTIANPTATKPGGFAIAGADNKWAWADAVISKDTVIVSSASVAAPTKVRYGWGQNPPVNLFNGAGLPASPFQTDGAQLPVALAQGGTEGRDRAARAAGKGRMAQEGRRSDALGRKKTTLDAHGSPLSPVFGQALRGN